MDGWILLRRLVLLEHLAVLTNTKFGKSARPPGLLSDLTGTNSGLVKCLPSPCGLAESAINKQIPTTTITQHPRIITVPYFYPHLRRIRRVQLYDSNNDKGGSHSRPSSQGKTKLLFYVAAQWKLGRVKILASFCL